MPNPDRPKIGPADAETRRKKLREVLDAESGGDPTKARPKPAKKTMLDAVSEGVDQADGKKKPKKQLQRRYGPNGKTIDEIIEE